MYGKLYYIVYSDIYEYIYQWKINSKTHYSLIYTIYGNMVIYIYI